MVPPLSPSAVQTTTQQQPSTTSTNQNNNNNNNNPLLGSPLPPRYRFRELLMGATTDTYNTYIDDGESVNNQRQQQQQKNS
ncbi:hypothetical protein HUG17_10412 [Dermatophagoides farinae]|uniref:Uncharacterized protein n=1 Tax=Dermatophagoides farinae TaxID=6954 RepID=A0A9D4SBB8_DERFA|nr:hypothetical protein HUG17_10412 [Dermatophagoides farinae]